jgi:hypothetical protein
MSALLLVVDSTGGMIECAPHASAHFTLVYGCASYRLNGAGEAQMTEPRFSIPLSADEVLVLFEFLHRINEDPATTFEDQAEQRVAWDLEAALESANEHLLSSDYDDRLRAARDRLRDPPN